MLGLYTVVTWPSSSEWQSERRTISRIPLPHYRGDGTCMTCAAVGGGLGQILSQPLNATRPVSDFVSCIFAVLSFEVFAFSRYSFIVSGLMFLLFANK